MKWYHGLEPIVEENVRLADRTWYRLGGAARYFCTPASITEVCEIVKRAQDAQLPLKVLGGGANVLVRDEGFDGIVMQLGKDDFGHVTIDHNKVRADSAVDLPDLVRRTVNEGLAGLERMAGIPGTVGGAVRMNAGGRYGEIGDMVAAATVIAADGSLHEWDRSHMHFCYRGSNFVDVIVIDVTFELSFADGEELRNRHREIWEYKKSTQPFTRNNAGCMFKNPAGHYAGQLIDRAGLKGESCGGATVCEQHANFIVTDPDTRTSDILTLVDRIQSRVRDRYGVDLELEVDVW